MENQHKNSLAFADLTNKDDNQSIYYIKSPYVKTQGNLLRVGNTYVLITNFCNLKLMKLRLVQLIDSDHKNQRYTLVLQDLISHQILHINLECIIDNSQFNWQLFDYENMQAYLERLAVIAYCESR